MDNINMARAKTYLTEAQKSLNAENFKTTLMYLRLCETEVRQAKEWAEGHVKEAA